MEKVAIFKFLDRTFPGRWIGRDGPMPWPPRSSDITPLDFFLWGYVKSNVFRTPVNGLFQRTCSTEHGKSSNIVWTFSVLPREPTSRSTEVSKKLPAFHYDLAQTAYGRLNLFARQDFSKQEKRDSL
jgi:hypothetical protein